LSINQIKQQHRYVHRIGIALAVILITGSRTTAGAQVLGSAAPFGVLGASAVTNTGNTVITGDLGVSPGTSITGFPPGSFTGTIHDDDSVAAQAHSDATTAYNGLAGLAPTQTLTGQNLGGLTLQPGVYFFASSAQMTGTLTLDGLGNSNSEFVFQIGSTLTTASNSSVVLDDSAAGSNVFWQVGSSATLGTTTAFFGNVVANASVTLNTGATDPCGGMYALNGAVTMDSNTIGGGCIPVSPGGTTPEPSTLAYLIGTCVVSMSLIRRRRKV